MEICKTKESLIKNYEHYEPKFYREWINLSLRKLSGKRNQLNLNSTQIETFNRLLDKNITKDHFLHALNLLTYEQISYVGW